MRSASAADDRGSAAAEFAVALPAVMLVLALCLGGVGAAAQQVRLQDAAADAARGLGRGDGAADVSARAGRVVPGVVVTRFTEGELVCAQLAAPAAGPLGAAGVRISATGCALDGGR